MIRYCSNMSIVNCKELFCKFSFIGKAYQEMFPKQLGTLEIKSIRNHLKYSVGWIQRRAKRGTGSNGHEKMKFFQCRNQLYQSIAHRKRMKKYKNIYTKTSPLPQISVLDSSFSLSLSYTSCYTPLLPIATRVLHMV